jgi:hypothetical protein
MFSSPQAFVKGAANAALNNPLVNPYRFLGSVLGGMFFSGAGAQKLPHNLRHVGTLPLVLLIPMIPIIFLSLLPLPRL